MNMHIDEQKNIFGEEDTPEKLKRLDMLMAEANTIRKNDGAIIRNLFSDFFGTRPTIGVGFQRAYGAILAGDYFDMIKLPDASFLFIFADISGHGLPAYTTLIRLRSALTLSINDARRDFEQTGVIDQKLIVTDIATRFTDIMEAANSDDFACVNFTFIRNEDHRYRLSFFNHSMLFPIIIRKSANKLFDIYNLNREEKGWSPEKGNLLGRDLRILLEDDYLDVPLVEFYLHEGDSILYYSDGIIEACNGSPDIQKEDFGDARMEAILRENYNLHPQVIIDIIFESVYRFIGNPKKQKDDMTAVMIDFPSI